MAGVDFHDGAQPCAQLRHGRSGFDLDPHRHPLRDLDPIAGGILCRDNRELRPCSGTQAFHHALPCSLLWPASSSAVMWLRKIARIKKVDTAPHTVIKGNSDEQ